MPSSAEAHVAVSTLYQYVLDTQDSVKYCADEVATLQLQVEALHARIDELEDILYPPPPYVPEGWTETMALDWRDSEVSTFSKSRQSGIVAMQSGPQVNVALTPNDSGNSDLQKPTRWDAVEIVADPLASHSQALAVRTKIGQYLTSSGMATGWVNGRVQSERSWSAPMMLWQRLRWEGDQGWETDDKSAPMWWPVGGGWAWEADIAEHFPGMRGVSFRHHMDVNSDGAAKEQIIKDVSDADMTSYHWYGLLVTDDLVVYYVDAEPVLRISDPKWLFPKGASGVWALGRALRSPRASQTKACATVVDQVRVYQPTSQV